LEKHVQIFEKKTLPMLAVEDAAFAENPMPYIEAARLQHPWLAKIHIGYLVHGYQAIKDLLYMDDKLLPAMDGVVSFYGGRGTLWGDFQEQMMIARSGAVHARLRSSVAQAFTPSNANKLRSQMREVISTLLEEWAPKSRFDFTEFASYFPVTVLCRLLGTSADQIPMVRSSLETQGLVISMDPGLFPALQAGMEVLWKFVDSLIIEREKNDNADGGFLIDSLIAAKNKGEMDETELRQTLIMLFVAGYDTSKNMLSLIMYTLINRPVDYSRCAHDLAYCRQVVLEMFRHTSITTPPRIVGSDFSYDGIQFKKGETIFFANSVAGRDPAAFPDPMQFNPDRPNKSHHLAFGRGAHICLGQHLARAQLEEGLHLIAQRLSKPELVGEVTWRPFLGVWGLRSLPIKFESTQARDSLDKKGVHARAH
jgi:cytochrome P450